MAKIPHNMVKSDYNSGEYVARAGGYVFRVVKSNSSFGRWQASLARFNPTNPRLSNRFFYGWTLAEVSANLDEFALEIKAQAIVEKVA